MAQLTRPSPVFTHPEWTLSNHLKTKTAEVDRTQSERIHAESDRVISATAERTDKVQRDVDKKLNQRVDHIKYWSDELNNKLAQLEDETNQLLGERARLQESTEAYDENAHLNRQCLEYRSRRRGIDLVDDDVQKELRKEAEIIQGVQSLLKRTLEQADEQARLNRKARYNLEKDLKDKQHAYELDKLCAEMKSGSSNVPFVNGVNVKIDPNSVTPEQWQDYTDANLQAAERERMSSLNLRSLIDSILAQVVQDLQAQHDNVQLALNKRIRETRDAKAKLETQHADVLDEIRRKEENIDTLKLAIRDKEAPLQLAKARLATRSQRPNVELCRDSAQYRLVEEVEEIHRSVAALYAQLDEAEASLKALTRRKLDLESDIDVKSNSVYVDEVQVGTIRKSIKIAGF